MVRSSSPRAGENREGKRRNAASNVAEPHGKGASCARMQTRPLDLVEVEKGLVKERGAMQWALGNKPISALEGLFGRRRQRD